MLLTLNLPKNPTKDPKTPYFLPNYAQTALGLEQKLCPNEGGEGRFYRKACTPRAASCHVARDDAARAVQLPRGDLILPRQHLSEFSSVLAHVSFFDPIF